MQWDPDQEPSYLPGTTTPILALKMQLNADIYAMERRQELKGLRIYRDMCISSIQEAFKLLGDCSEEVMWKLLEVHSATIKPIAQRMETLQKEENRHRMMQIEVETKLNDINTLGNTPRPVPMMKSQQTYDSDYTLPSRESEVTTRSDYSPSEDLTMSGYTESQGAASQEALWNSSQDALTSQEVSGGIAMTPNGMSTPSYSSMTSTFLTRHLVDNSNTGQIITPLSRKARVVPKRSGQNESWSPLNTPLRRSGRIAKLSMLSTDVSL